jgi:hypothetical protein
MKTYLIQLQKFDTITSTIDKMSWAKTSRVLLIWPKRGKPLLSIPDVELIKREALAVGVELAFVCTDSEIVEFAEANTISVFQSVTQAERVAWKKPGKGFTPNRRKKVVPKVVRKKTSNGALSGIVRAFSMLLAGLAVIALVLFFIPSATITVHPLLTTKEIVIEVWASPEVVSLNINGSLPAQVKVISLTKTATGQSSGTAGLPSAFAEGQVVFTNISTQAVTVPIGTVLITNDEGQIKFATQSETVLDPGAISEPIIIRAVDPGTAGNVVTGAITTIEGQLAGLLDVSNDAPTSGGEDVEAPSPTEEDYAALSEQMLISLRQEALSLYPQGEMQLITATLDDGTITSEIRSVDPGTAADTFSLTINVEFKGLIYSSSDLDKLVDGAMQASLETGTIIYGQGVQFEEVGHATGNFTDGATWSIKARTETGAVIDENAVIAAVAGKDISETLIMIDSFIPSRQQAGIQTFPGFWKWMPWLSLNTRIVAE